MQRERSNHKGHFVCRVVSKYYNIRAGIRATALGIYFNVCKSCQLASVSVRAHSLSPSLFLFYTRGKKKEKRKVLFDMQAT